MDLVQLRAFVAIADAGGVTRAARQLNVSQPALSRQLQTLEYDLGVALFTREQRRLRLTPAGDDLLRRARALLVDAEALAERAQAFRNCDAGVIRLGATPPMIEATLAPFLSDWRRRHAGIDIHIIEDGGSNLAQRLDDGDVHIAYVPGGDSRFECRLLYPIHVVAAVAKGHALAGPTRLELNDVAKVPLHILKKGFGSRDWFDDACHAAAVRPTFAMESASHNAIFALASAGYCVGILPSAVAPRRDVALIPLAHNGVPIGRWTTLAWSKRRYLPPYARAFIDEFGAYARAHFPGRDLVKRAPKIAEPALGGYRKDAAAASRRKSRQQTSDV
ncbi:MAG: LysR family transcriptional regulator [Hyphomicrobiaceae bacterium]